MEEKIRLLVQTEYSVVGDFKSMSEKVYFRHNLCGHIYPVMPTRFIKQNSRCPKCIGRDKTEQEIKELFHKLEGSDYRMASYFKNMRSEILIEHMECGSVYKSTIHKFVNQQQRCPSCKLDRTSKGAKRIKYILENKNINYEMEFRIPECKHIISLPFDFAILKDNQILGLIEFDGEQHFREIELWGGKESFEGIQKRDKIKDTYCEEHKIPLLRIAYYEYSEINTKIDDFLNRIL